MADKDFYDEKAKGPKDIVETSILLGRNMPVTMTACESIGLSGNCDRCPFKNECEEEERSK